MSDLYLTLKNGMKMPRLGMGTWMLGEHLSIYQQEKKALQAGLDAGFTLIDTAEMYGNGLSEKLIGDTIQGYSREKLFLVSKVYPHLSLIHISEPTRRTPISYAVFCLKKKKLLLETKKKKQISAPTKETTTNIQAETRRRRKQ